MIHPYNKRNRWKHPNKQKPNITIYYYSAIISKSKVSYKVKEKEDKTRVKHFMKKHTQKREKEKRFLAIQKR